MFQNLKNKYHLLVAIIANYWYRHPSRDITVIGVTGTDGKTTTVSLIYHILQAAQKNVSMVSTVYAKIGGTEHDTGFHVSTPHSLTVQRFLRESVDNGDQYFVMETTSHALDQNRVYGVEYAAGVITNITHEHLDYHKTYERYVQAKCRLLHQSRTRIVNREDMSFPHITKQVSDLITYGIAEGDYHGDISDKIGLPLPEFQKYNYLAAFAVARELGIDTDTIYQALKTFTPPPGRIAVIREKPVTAIVDFAHTPHSLKQILSAVRHQYLSNTHHSRLIHIFGCASERDIQKRPLMGVESATYADTVILTEEDYRNEDPEAINAEIAAGLEQQGYQKVAPADFTGTKGTYTSIPDRGNAVSKAVALAADGDVIIATGKGHEQSLCRGNAEEPWNDPSALTEALNARYGTT